MPLQTAWPILKQDIRKAFQDAKKQIEVAAETGDVDKINRDLADAIADAIHAYTQQAVVSTFVNTAVIGVGGGVPGPVVGTGLGAGNGKLL